MQFGQGQAAGSAEAAIDSILFWLLSSGTSRLVQPLPREKEIADAERNNQPS